MCNVHCASINTIIRTSKRCYCYSCVCVSVFVFGCFVYIASITIICMLLHTYICDYCECGCSGWQLQCCGIRRSRCPCTLYIYWSFIFRSEYSGAVCFWASAMVDGLTFDDGNVCHHRIVIVIIFRHPALSLCRWAGSMCCCVVVPSLCGSVHVCDHMLACVLDRARESNFLDELINNLRTKGLRAPDDTIYSSTSDITVVDNDNDICTFIELYY